MKDAVIDEMASRLSLIVEGEKQNEDQIHQRKYVGFTKTLY